MDQHLYGEYRGQFNVGYIEAASASDQVLVADPGAGKSIYLTDVVICAGTATEVTLEEDGATDVTVMKLFADVEGDSLCHSFTTPFKLAANEALQVTSNGTFSITVTGFYAKG